MLRMLQVPALASRFGQHRSLICLLSEKDRSTQNAQFAHDISACYDFYMEIGSGISVKWPHSAAILLCTTKTGLNIGSVVPIQG